MFLNKDFLSNWSLSGSERRRELLIASVQFLMLLMTVERMLNLKLAITNCTLKITMVNWRKESLIAWEDTLTRWELLIRSRIRRITYMYLWETLLISGKTIFWLKNTKKNQKIVLIRVDTVFGWNILRTLAFLMHNQNDIHFKLLR